MACKYDFTENSILLENTVSIELNDNSNAMPGVSSQCYTF